MNLQLKDFIVSENLRILDALKMIDANGYQILFVTDGSGKLVGALSDGDIRRFFLKGGKKEDRCNAAMNRRFIKAYDYATAKKLTETCRIVPIVSEDESPDKIVMRDRIVLPVPLDIPVVIQAGGLGTRLFPYTKILPKPLIPIGEKPIIERIVDQFAAFGCHDFYVIVNYKKNMIKSYFSEEDHPYQITFIDETEPLGTGGGLSLLKDVLSRPFVLTNCDILIDMDFERLVREHTERKDLITMVCANKHFKIPYGVVTVDSRNRILEIKEKPELDYLTNTGLYLVENRVINEIVPHQSIGFPTIFENYRQKGERVSIFTVSDSQWIDMGEIEKLDEVNARIGNRSWTKD